MEVPFFKSPLLRYYKAFTVKSQEKKQIIVRMHSNKLFLLFLHPEHPAMNKQALEVVFNFSTSSLSGKRKKGATNLQPSSKLLQIRTDEEEYVVQSGIFGKLIETNEYLLKDPSEVKNPEGFLAVLMPPLNKIDSILADLLEPYS